MIYDLKNSEVHIKVDSIGAEIKSIKRINDINDIEYLWQLNPNVWERQAPLLFPIIGRLKDKEYIHNGKNYTIDIHGFARNKEFEVELVKENEINFVLKDDNGTLKEYPFKFKLTINYKLENNSIIKTHITENLNENVMFYEIGGHEGYNLSLFQEEKMEDYYIEFQNETKLLTYTADENIMMNKEKVTVPLENGKLFLSPEVFKNDALIMDDFVVRKVSLRNTRNNRGIDIEFEDFKYLGLWTKYMRSNYICIEPWSSLPDCNYIGKELSNKKDIRKINSGDTDINKYTITVI